VNCPTCIDERLQIRHRHGIEIDYCQGCRGLWLDRGELDKLLAQASDEESAARHLPHEAPPRPMEDWIDERTGRAGAPRRRRGLLADILDFG
jgi:Zn-finger nucleic acid-binding protein